MLTFYIGIYTFVLALLWWLFIVAKIHAYKFKDFSLHITKVTNILFIFLLILSIIWYLFIFYFTTNTTTVVKNYSSWDIQEVNY